ncbi:phage/plasmid primase, P4 family [Herminiimonas sp. CN]|uniref:DNA primase family protein n=1 Tax=Herminiimonas sp. CN TaxID=1349818 RepID=UPI000556505F|nr:phage/plasmid primase, P4 family [Herminiimonas sp. CN]
MASHPITVTLFRSAKEAHGRKKIMSYDELHDMLASAARLPNTENDKKAQGMFSPVEFQGNHRKNDNVRSVHAIVIEHDAGTMSVNEAAKVLERLGLVATIYTSFKHTADSPRWRVVLPLHAPIQAKERLEYVQALNGEYGGVIAPESETVGQCWFYGGYAEGSPFECRRIYGAQTIDQLGLLDLADPLPCKGKDEGKDSQPRDTDPIEALAQTNLAWPDDELHNRTLDDALAAIGIPPKKYPPWRDLVWAVAATGLACAKKKARAWSKLDSENYDEDKFDEVWNSDNQSRRSTIGPGTLIKAAKDTGCFIDPRVKPDAARPDGSHEDKTDVGNVNLLVRLANGNLKFINETGEGLYWNGSTHERGAAANAAIHGLALAVGEHWRELAENAERQADNAGDKEERKHLLKVAEGHRAWRRTCRSAKAITSMQALAKKDPRLSISMSALDNNQNLIGVANGVVDLTTAQLRHVAREDYVTRHCPLPYDPNAKASRFDKLIEEITGAPDGKGYTSRPELAAYVLRFLGYCLTGHTRSQVMGIFTGPGANGKNILLDLVQTVMGRYAMSLTPEVLMSTSLNSDGERAQPFLASLAGVRLAIASESKDGQKLNEAMVKRHTGGGFITARGLHQDPFQFLVSHKLVLMTNALPAIQHLDDAMRGRLHIVPFDRAWNRPGHPDPDPDLPEGDPNLADELRAEAVGVFTRLVLGAKEYHEKGLAPPDVVKERTLAYLSEQGHLGAWLPSMDRVPAKEGKSLSDLFECFMKWCASMGYKRPTPGTERSFAHSLSATGIDKVHTRSGARYGLASFDRTQDDL